MEREKKCLEREKKCLEREKGCLEREKECLEREKGCEKVKKTTTSKGKTKKGKQFSAQVIPSSDLEDVDTQCIFCRELYSNTQDDDWIQMSVLLTHSGLILHEIAFDHVTQRQHHVHSMAAIYEIVSV